MSYIKPRIVIIMPKLDIYSFMTSQVIFYAMNRMNLRCQYIIVNNKKPHLWYNLYKLKNSMFYILGESPPFESIPNNLKFHIKATDKSILENTWKLFWDDAPLTGIYESVNNLWKGEFETKYEVGLRCALYQFTQIAADEGMEAGLKAYHKLFKKPNEIIWGVLEEIYHEKVQELYERLKPLEKKFTILQDEYLDEHELPKEWKGLKVLVVDVTNGRIDIGLHMHMCQDNIDLLIHCRKLQMPYRRVLNLSLIHI